MKVHLTLGDPVTAKLRSVDAALTQIYVSELVGVWVWVSFCVCGYVGLCALSQIYASELVGVWRKLVVTATANQR